LGAFNYKEMPDFELASLDCDKSIAFQIRNDDKLKEG
jgi:hypothetical protein